MPADYHHGVRVVELTDGVRPIRTVSTSVIGIVGTAAELGDSVTADAFPLNRPVLVTNIQEAISKLGAGTLKKSLQAIADQTRPIMVVVRVATGVDEAATNANVIGGLVDGQYTGLQALLAANAVLGVKPRIIGAPGLDTQVVANAIATLCQNLRAFGYVYAHEAEDVSDALDYQENFGQRELMVIWPDFIAGDVDPAFSVAYALGLRAKIDNEIGWHKTLSNVALNGPTGINKDVSWDLQNPNTDAGLLNEGKITTLVRYNGFRFWGSRTCSSEPKFAFENYVRTAQVLADTMAEGIGAWSVDAPMTTSLVKDIVESINAKFRSLKGQGYIIDGSCWYDPDANTSTSLADGQLVLDYDYTPVPPAENITLRQRITDRYLLDFANKVNA